MTRGNHARLLGTALVLLAAGSLAGCTSLGEQLGTGKDSPDEFAVVTKAPLIIPPDFNLQPPKPGAPPANQVSPTQAAQAALYNSDPASTAASIPGNMSQGEKLLLAYAGAAQADSSIRQVIAAENKNMQATDEGFTDNLMFWQKSQGDQGVDADAEARRVATQKASQPAAPAPAPSDQTIQRDDGANNAH